MSRASESLWAAWFTGLLLLVPVAGCGQGAAATTAVGPVGNRPAPAPVLAQPAALTIEAAVATVVVPDETAPVSAASPAESPSPPTDVETPAAATETLVDVDTESLEILRMLRDTWQGKSRSGAGDRDTRTASKSP